jgi:acetolactate synthase small subunit
MASRPTSRLSWAGRTTTDHDYRVLSTGRSCPQSRVQIEAGEVPLPEPTDEEQTMPGGLPTSSPTEEQPIQPEETSDPTIRIDEIPTLRAETTTATLEPEGGSATILHNPQPITPINTRFGEPLGISRRTQHLPLFNIDPTPAFSSRLLNTRNSIPREPLEERPRSSALLTGSESRRPPSMVSKIPEPPRREFTGNFRNVPTPERVQREANEDQLNAYARQLYQAFDTLRGQLNQEADQRAATINIALDTIERINRRTETKIDRALERMNELNENSRTAATNAYHTHNECKKICDVTRNLEGRIVALAPLLSRIEDITSQLEEQVEQINEKLEVLSEFTQMLDNRTNEILRNQAKPQPPQEETEPPRQRRHFRVPRNRSEAPMYPEFREQAQSTQVEDYTTSILPKSAKMKIPEAYKGKRGPESDTFLMKMEIYFKDHEGLFDDRKKIISTLTNIAEGEGS